MVLLALVHSAQLLSLGVQIGESHISLVADPIPANCTAMLAVLLKAKLEK